MAFEGFDCTVGMPEYSLSVNKSGDACLAGLQLADTTFTVLNDVGLDPPGQWYYDNSRLYQGAVAGLAGPSFTFDSGAKV